jgi:hypothetical protein
MLCAAARSFRAEPTAAEPVPGRSAIPSSGSQTAPFEVAIVNEGGALSLGWTQAWSPWIEQDGAGRPDIEVAIRRLSALGWNIRSADSP